MTLKLFVSIENWEDETDEYTHISQWTLSKKQQKTLVSFVRQLFEHPETKYSSQLKKIPRNIVSRKCK